MGKRVPVVLSTRTFQTKHAATAHFSAMLARYKLGQKLETEDACDLYSLLTRHPEASQKIGVGVESFYVANAPDDLMRTTTRCFWLRRFDGTMTDFSFNQCVAGRPKTTSERVRNACREAVRESLYFAKKKVFDLHADAEGKVLCEISGERISWSEAHLDHKYPMTFQIIAGLFAEAKKLTDEHVERPCDQQAAYRFVDQRLALEFAEYHANLVKRHGTLRIVRDRENEAMSSRNRIRPAKNPVDI